MMMRPATARESLALVAGSIHAGHSVVHARGYSRTIELECSCGRAWVVDDGIAKKVGTTLPDLKHGLRNALAWASS